jgi:hypothetical protein
MDAARELLKLARDIVGLRITVDEAYVAGLKRMMASDIRDLESSINSPEDAERMRQTVNAVRKKWEDVFYNVILGKEMSKLSEGSKDIGWVAEKLRSEAWTAVIAFGDIGHHLAEWPRHWSKYPDDFGREKKYVFDRIKRAARDAYAVTVNLVKYHRTEEQKTVDFGERVTVGNFILLPEGGVTEDKIKGVASFVGDVQSLVRRAGFGEVLSRMVIHVTNRSESGLKAGHYQPSDDSMAILPLGAYDAGTMIHEMGHRNWYRVLSAGGRDYWKAAFDGDLIEITKGDVREITEEVRRTWPGDGLTAQIRQSIADYEKAHGDDPVAPYKVNYFRENLHFHDDLNFWAETWEKDLVGQKVMRNYVTDYANTNEIEAYAEVFRNYVLRKSIPAEVLYWFRRVSF